MDISETLNRNQVARAFGVVGGAVTRYVEIGWTGAVEKHSDNKSRAFTAENILSLIVCKQLNEYGVLQARDIVEIGGIVRSRWAGYERGAGIEKLAEQMLVVSVKLVDLYRTIDYKFHGLNGASDGLIDDDPTAEIQIRLRLDAPWKRMVEIFDNAEAAVTA